MWSQNQAIQQAFNPGELFNQDQFGPKHANIYIIHTLHTYIDTGVTSLLERGTVLYIVYTCSVFKHAGQSRTYVPKYHGPQ